MIRGLRGIPGEQVGAQDRPARTNLPRLERAPIAVIADHVTADAEQIGHGEPDVDLALHRLFALPLTQLFSSEATDCSDTGIRAMTSHLQEALRKGLPDYSALLDPAPAATAVATAAPASMPPLPSPTLPAPPTGTGAVHVAAGPSVQRRPIARRAVPYPAGRSVA